MKVLVLYGTTDGQTRKVARFASDLLVHQGHSVELLCASDAEGLAIARFDAVIAAGSVHAGHYQADLIEVLKKEAAAVSKVPNLFVSVSLTAAGDDIDDWAGLQSCVDRFAADTGWTPQQVAHVAGALRFGQYDFFRYWAMRWIAREKGETVDPDGEKEYTDWASLKQVLTDWVEKVALAR
jgi:menaquinone-dependent protoporphyrinogen oxidase